MSENPGTGWRCTALYGAQLGCSVHNCTTLCTDEQNCSLLCCSVSHRAVYKTVLKSTYYHKCFALWTAKLHFSWWFYWALEDKEYATPRQDFFCLCQKKISIFFGHFVRQFWPKYYFFEKTKIKACFLLDISLRFKLLLNPWEVVWVLPRSPSSRTTF